MLRNINPAFKEIWSKIHPKGSAIKIKLRRVNKESILIKPARISSSTLGCNKLYTKVILIPRVMEDNKNTGKNQALCENPKNKAIN